MKKNIKSKLVRAINNHYTPAIILAILLVIGMVFNYSNIKKIFWKNLQKTFLPMKTELPTKPLKEKTINISAYLIPNACYYGAGAGIASYLEGISFDDFIWYGRPARFKYSPSKVPLGRGLILEAFHNLGYTSFHGSTNKDFSPTSFYSHPDENNKILFDSENAAFDFLKRLASAGIPVIVRINTEPLAYFKYSFKIFAGYDETNVYLSWKPYPEDTSLFEKPGMIDPKPYPIKDFLKSWSMQDHIFLWFEKTGVKKNETEIMEINKKDAEMAYGDMQDFIHKLEDGSFKKFSDHEDITITRTVVSRKLNENGYTEAAEKYRKAAEIYNKKGNDLIKSFSNTASLEKEAVDSWAKGK